MKAEAPANYSRQPQAQPQGYATYNNYPNSAYNTPRYDPYNNRGYAGYNQPQQPPARNSYGDQRQRFCADVVNELRARARAIIDDVLFRRHADPNYLGQVLRALENDEYNGELYNRIDRAFRGNWPTPQQIETLLTNYVDEVLNRDRYARGGAYRQNDSWSSQYGYGEAYARRDGRYEYAQDACPGMIQRPPYRPEYARQGYYEPQRVQSRGGYSLDDIRDETSMDNSYNAYARTTPNVQPREFTTASPTSYADAPRSAKAAPVKEVVKPKATRAPLEPLEDATAVNKDIKALLKLRESDPWKDTITVDAVCTYECTADGKPEITRSPWDEKITKEKVPVTYATMQEPVQNLVELRARITDCDALNQKHRISLVKFKQIIPLDISNISDARGILENLQQMDPVLNEAKTEFKDLDTMLLTAAGVVKTLYTDATLKTTLCPLVTQMFNAASRSTLVAYTGDTGHEASGLKIEELKDLIDLVMLEDPAEIGLDVPIDTYQSLLNICLAASLFSVFKPGKKTWLDMKRDEDINLILSRADTFVYVDGERVTKVDESTSTDLRSKVLNTLNERTYLCIERRAMDTDLDITNLLDLAKPNASKPLEGGVKYAAIINQLAARVGGVDILTDNGVYRVSPSTLGTCSISRRLAS